MLFLEIPYLPILCLPLRTLPACIPHCITWPIWSPLCTLAAASCSWLFLYTAYFLFLLILTKFFNGVLEVPGALNNYTLSRLILLTLSVSRNPTLTHLLLFGNLDSLLGNLIASTPGLAYFLLMPRTLSAVSSFSSNRVYPLNFLPPHFLRLTLTLITYGLTLTKQLLLALFP